MQEDVESILLLLKKPELKGEEFYQLKDLIVQDQFLDCAFDEAHNAEIWERYILQMSKASTREVSVAKEIYRVNAKRAFFVGCVVLAFLAALGLGTGVILLPAAGAIVALPLIALPATAATLSFPMVYEWGKLQFTRLSTCKKDLHKEKRACESAQKNGRKQIAKLAEVETGMIGLCDYAEFHAGNVEKVMAGTGSQKEKVQKLWEMYRNPERLDSLNRLKEELLTQIADFEELIRQLKSEIR